MFRRVSTHDSQNLKLFDDSPMKVYRKFFSDMSVSLLHAAGGGLKSEAGHSWISPLFDHSDYSMTLMMTLQRCLNSPALQRRLWRTRLQPLTRIQTCETFLPLGWIGNQPRWILPDLRVGAWGREVVDRVKLQQARHSLMPLVNGV